MSEPRQCPICGEPTHPDRQPFCSARCQKIDLNRWLSGSYAIPDTENPVTTDGFLDEPDDVDPTVKQ